jgi:uncharacterized protein (TIGR02453 family)
MKAGFPGFPKEGIAFLKGLKKHNNREWFQARKRIFEEQVKAPMLELADAVNREMMRFAPAHVTDPAKALYRIYRDTRFSNDKTPYKTHIAATFPRRDIGNKHGMGGYYFHVSPESVAVGGGIYMPQPPELLALRAHLAEHGAELEKIVRRKPVRSLLGELQGSRLSRVPKCFPADHPYSELLKLKQYLLYVELDPEIATTPALFTEVLKRLKAMAPFIEFLNRPLLRKALPHNTVHIEE